MKKIIILTIAFILSNLAFAKDWSTIRIGVEGAYPPFSKTNPDGSLSGFDIDITNALCDQLNAKCVLVKQDWDGMIPALLSNRYDAIIASMSITEERKKRVDFTNKYYSSVARFIAKKSDNISIVNALMNGLKVGVQQETVMDRFLTDNWGGIIEIKRYGTQEDANNDLRFGRLDMVFAEFGPGEDFIASNGNYEFVGPSYSHPKWFGEGIGIAVRKQNSDLKVKLNNAIDALRENGVYNNIQAKYFSYDIYGE